MATPFDECTNSSVEDQQAFAEVLAEVSADIEAGRTVDWDDLVAQFPQFASGIYRVRPALEGLRAFREGGASAGDVSVLLAGGPAPQQTLGDFAIIREVGRGGMGTVFEAEQISMGRRVALKVLPFAALAHETALKRFRNEVRAAAALDHPNIVSVYSVGEVRGVHFYAMQLIRGQSLAEWIQRLREERRPPSLPLPPGESRVEAARTTRAIDRAAASTAVDSHNDIERYRTVARLGIQAAEALQHAHEQGVLHRDVKPGNLLLDADGNLFVTDFGLARIESDAGLTMSGDVLGTLRYMAPEQALAQRAVADHRADVYSLGATLYEFLAIRPAFDESDRAELLKQIAFEEPTPLRRLDHRIPAEMDIIVQKAMSKAPEDRYESAQLVANDLRAFLDNRPLMARPTSLHDRLRKCARRHQRVAVGLVAGLMALSAILAASIYLVNRARATAVSALNKSAESAALLADQLYEADVALAYQYWEKGRSNEVPALLERHRPAPGEADRRGYEWHVLHSIARPPQSLVLSGHTGAVNELAAFPDGRRIASVGDDGAVRVWDALNAQLLATFTVSSAPLQSVAISPDGRDLAAANEAVYLCDLNKGDGFQEIFRGDHNAESIAFNADGDGLVAGFRYHEICLLSLDGAVIARRQCAARMESLEFAPVTGQLIVPDRQLPPGGESGANAIIQICNGESLNMEQECAPRVITQATFARPSPCGRYIAIGSRYGTHLTLYHVGKRWATPALGEYRNQMTDLAWSPDGSAVVLARNNGVVQRVAIAADAQGVQIDDRIRAWDAHTGRVNCARHVGPDRLATCGTDGLIKVWDVSSLNQQRSAGNTLGLVFSGCLSPDGQRLAVVSSTKFFVLDGETMRTLNHVDVDEISTARSIWAPDSQTAAIWRHKPKTVTLLNRDGSIRKKLAVDFAVEGVDISPGGRTAAVIGEQSLQLIDLDQGHVLSQRRLPGVGLVARHAHRRDLIAHAGRFGEIVITDSSLSHIMHRLRCPSDVNCMAFRSDDAMLATGHTDGDVRVWRLDNGKLHAEIPVHDGNVFTLAYCGAGDTLISGGDDGSFRMASVDRQRAYGILFQRTGANSISSVVSASISGKRVAAQVYRTFEHQPDLLIWDVDLPSH